jgi:hypothetical protein
MAGATHPGFWLPLALKQIAPSRAPPPGPAAQAHRNSWQLPEGQAPVPDELA